MNTFDHTLSTKEYLTQSYRIDQRIHAKLDQVQSLRSLAEKATSILSFTGPSGSHNNQHMEDVIHKIIAIEEEIKNDLQVLLNLKQEIATIIKCVEACDLQTLLELRYLCFHSWEEIAVQLHHDLRWIHRLHNKALKEVDAIRHLRP